MLPKRTGKILVNGDKKDAKSLNVKTHPTYLKFAEINNQHDNNCEANMDKFW